MFLIKIHNGLCKIYPIKISISSAIIIMSIVTILFYRSLEIVGAYDKIIGAFVMVIALLLVISIFLYTMTRKTTNEKQ